MGNKKTHVEEIELMDLIFRKSGIDAVSKINIPDPTNPRKTFCEIDVLGVYKNIVIFVECVGEEKFGNKAKDFNSEIEQIQKNPEFLKTLKNSNSEFFDKHKKTIENFKNDTIVIKLIVSSKKDETIEEKKTWRGKLFVWGREEIEYFKVISDTAYRYCKFEIFRSLKIEPTDIIEEIHQLPKKTYIMGIGEKDKDRYLVNFLFPVKDLLKLSFISRYHYTEEEGFQRLADKVKLRDMRGYLIKKREPYPNSLLVLLHPDIKISKFKKSWIANVDKSMQKYCEKNLFKITIPERYGVFLIIDGQHRLFSFAQDCYHIFEKCKNEEERKKFKEDDCAIKKLANELQLAVTGIKFKNKGEKFFHKAGEKLFFEINTTHTKIKPEDVIDLMEIFYPDNPISKSNELLKKLNEKGPLANKIKVKFWQSKKIKRTSLIMYGGIKFIFNKKSNTFSIFDLIFKSQKKIKEYSDFCHVIITNYLFALKELINEKDKSKCEEIWSDIGLKNYYLTSAVGLGALLRLLRHLLTKKDKAFKLREKITDQIFESDLKKNIRNPKLIELFKTPMRIVIDKFTFTMGEFKKKGYAPNKWAQIEANFFHAIKDHTKDEFGDITLLKKQFRQKI